MFTQCNFNADAAQPNPNYPSKVPNVPSGGGRGNQKK